MTTDAIATIHELIDTLTEEQSTHCPAQAAREFALAKTALEDAQMRIVRGRIMKQGRFATPEDAAVTVHPGQLSFLEDDNDLPSAA